MAKYNQLRDLNPILVISFLKKLMTNMGEYLQKVKNNFKGSFLTFSEEKGNKKTSHIRLYCKNL